MHRSSSSSSVFSSFHPVIMKCELSLLLVAVLIGLVVSVSRSFFSLFSPTIELGSCLNEFRTRRRFILLLRSIRTVMQRLYSKLWMVGAPTNLQ